MMFGFCFAHAEDSAHRVPPKTRTDNVKEMVHGVEVLDPYRWLEDGNSQETKDWIKAQNEYTDALIGTFPAREALRRRLEELMRVDSMSVPFVRSGRYFFSKRERTRELAVICMRRGLGGEDEALIDPHSMSPDLTTSVGISDVAEDGSLMAYDIRRGGEDESEICLFDVNNRKDLRDRLPKAMYFALNVTHDKRGFYYTRHDENGSRVFYHAMGTDPAGDREIFGKGYGPDKGIGTDLSDDGRYLLITVWHGSAGQKTEIYYQDVVEKGAIVPVVNDIDARFVGQFGGKHLFLHTNWEAPKGRVFRVDLNNPARERWQEVIPQSDSAIEEFSAAGGKLLVNYLHNVSSRVKIFEPDGRHLRDIPLPALGSVSGMGGRWKDDEVFFSFSSFHIPTTTYRYSVKQGSQEVWWRLSVPVESDALEVKQAWYESKDGTRVPMFLVHSKDTKLDGSNPTLLTGYGGFNASLTPWFSSVAALWAESGGVLAVANLRGGGEFGEDWHRAGMFEKKQNVFDDFIAAAEWLVANRCTNPSKLAISGGSNGGLLVGAALTQRPELFQAVVCSYPLLDMVRYHKFRIAAFWVSEFGSAEDANQFKYIYAYSPYHRVNDSAKYPATLFITGESDTRVDPLHARKMAGRLQSTTASRKPVLLRYDATAGHSGGRPLSKQIEELTDEMSFLLWQLGMTFPASALLPR